MKNILLVILLLGFSQEAAAQYTNGAVSMANATVTGTAAAIVGSYRSSFTVEVAITSTGCVILKEVQGSCVSAFAIGDGGKMICRGVAGGDPPGFEFKADRGEWGGQICAKAATGSTSVDITRHAY